MAILIYVFIHRYQQPCRKTINIANTVEPLLSEPIGGVTIMSDNRQPKITGFIGVGRVDWRSDN